MWTVTADEREHIMLIKSGETLDMPTLRKVLNRIYIDNEGAYASYNKFADLSCIKNIEVDLDTIVGNVRTYRGITPPENVIKIAVYIPYGTTYALARTYELLTEDDTFNIEVLGSIAKCADFLNVDEYVINKFET